MRRMVGRALRARVALGPTVAVGCRVEAVPLGPMIVSLQTLPPCASLFPTLWLCGQAPLILLLQPLLRSVSLVPL